MTCPAEIGTEDSPASPLKMDRTTSGPRNAGRTLYCMGVDSLRGVANEPDIEAGPVRFSDHNPGDPADWRDDPPSTTDTSAPV